MLFILKHSNVAIDSFFSLGSNDQCLQQVVSHEEQMNEPSTNGVKEHSSWSSSPNHGNFSTIGPSIQTHDSLCFSNSIETSLFKNPLRVGSKTRELTNHFIAFSHSSAVADLGFTCLIIKSMNDLVLSASLLPLTSLIISKHDFDPTPTFNPDVRLLQPATKIIISRMRGSWASLKHGCFGVLSNDSIY